MVVHMVHLDIPLNLQDQVHVSRISLDSDPCQTLLIVMEGVEGMHTLLRVQMEDMVAIVLGALAVEAVAEEEADIIIMEVMLLIQEEVEEVDHPTML
jgi:hypothetical protein